jgi:uncharacterized membrane protein AbrB (regulator of aidB expression)
MCVECILCVYHLCSRTTYYSLSLSLTHTQGYKALFCELPAGYMLGMALVFVCMGCWLAKWTCKSKEVV